MLTQEQIKNLKKGDPLIIPGTFRRVDKDGAIWANIDGDYFYFSPSYVSLPSEHGTSIPPPKHDPPCRFKKGDRVRIKREINGRIIHHSFAFFEYDTIYTVKEDEVQKSYKSGHVSITDGNGNICTLSFYELELVTPVEELESFGVRYSKDKNCVEVYHRRHKHTVSAFYCIGGITREQAEEHAEAERDRLNAEWRKEAAND